jgi:hypothetical protein
MDINAIFGVGIAMLLSYIVYRSLRPTSIDFVPQRFGLLVAQDTGKSKVNQSKTGDASLAIERVRRRTIQGAGRVEKYKLKETHTQKGSTTGAFETYMLSPICPCPPKCNAYDIILDGGADTSNYCEYVGDGYLDAGNENTKACGV